MKVYILLLVFGFAAMSEASKIGLLHKGHAIVGKTLAKLEHKVETVGTHVLHHMGVTDEELAKIAKKLEAVGEEVEKEVEEEVEEVEEEVEEEAKEEGVTEEEAEKDLGLNNEEEAIIGEAIGAK